MFLKVSGAGNRKHMLVAARFLVLLTVSVLSKIFYSHEVEWVGERPRKPFQELRLVVFLNHTSLFEPLFTPVLPMKTLWDLARRGAFPAAKKSMDRPVFGKFIGLLAPRAISITRKRDGTWQRFLDQVRKDDLVIILPEGRMKRANGRDSSGNPMTVRGGVAELLRLLEQGKMILAYSGGLHHVQVPGGGFPKLFKKIKIRLEVLNIEDYLKPFTDIDGQEYRDAVAKDMQQKRDYHCPQ